MRLAPLPSLILLLATTTSFAQETVDPFQFRTSADAQAAFEPMSGSPPVTLDDLEGRKVVRMPVRFAGTTIDRASWDYKGRLDLSDASEIRFRVRCEKLGPVAHFNVYFRSGDGWYTAGFSPDAENQWSEVIIRKEETNIEGTPAGWAKVDRIRISAWRGADEDTALYVADLTQTRPTSGVVIVRGDALATLAPGEEQTSRQQTAVLAGLLRDAGLDCLVLSDAELTPAILKDKSLLILPHNPRMPEAAEAATRAYLDAGGKLFAFYQFPASLHVAAGIEVGPWVREKQPGNFATMRRVDTAPAAVPATIQQNSWNVMRAQPLPGRGHVAATWFDAAGTSTDIPAVILTDRAAYVSHVLTPDHAESKRQLVMAVASVLAPQVPQKAATAALASLGTFGPYPSFDRAVTALGDRPQAASARSLRSEAQALLASGNALAALDKIDAARRQLIDAYCASQTAAPNEVRGIWCHSAFGVAGLSWDEAIRRLSENGINTIYPNMLWGGSAYYPSGVLPIAPELATRGDQIAECLAACRKYGVAMHVWKVNWNMGGSAPDAFVRQMRDAGRTQVAFDRTPQERWLCPSHPLNQDLEIAAMTEVATKYDVDGIHFDYIRYPDADHCFCDGCHTRFEQHVGHKVGNWPAAVREDPALKAAWNAFRENNITRVVRGTSEKVRALGKKTKISAAVFPNYATDRFQIAQDWKLWLERGYLDFVCPMDYTPSTGEFREIVRRQLALAGKSPVYPGIGVGVWPGAERDIVKLIDMVRATRQLGCPGFTLFEYGPAEAQSVVHRLGMGITKPSTPAR